MLKTSDMGVRVPNALNKEQEELRLTLLYVCKHTQR